MAVRLKQDGCLFSDSVKLPAEKFIRDDSGEGADLSAETKQIILSSKEDLFAEIR